MQSTASHTSVQQIIMPITIEMNKMSWKKKRRAAYLLSRMVMRENDVDQKRYPDNIVVVNALSFVVVFVVVFVDRLADEEKKDEHSRCQSSISLWRLAGESRGT